MSTTPQSFSRIAARLIAAIFIGASLLMLPLPAMAAGDDSDSDSGGGSSPSSSKPACSTIKSKNSCQGKSYCFWSNSSSKCKTKKIKSEISPIDKLYNQGRTLAKSGEYAKAIAVLKSADQTDPHVLNYLGYSHRKSGDLKTAIAYYKTALAIDPDFVLAREYLGEGYVKAGRLDLARLELEQIGRRCGKGCKEYVELAAVIDTRGDSAW